MEILREVMYDWARGPSGIRTITLISSIVDSIFMRD